MSIQNHLFGLFGAVTVASCAAPTAPSTLQVDTKTVRLTSQAEYDTWPFTPTIAGGRQVVVRGTGPFACGSAVGTATLRGGHLDVSIRPAAANRICPAIYALWQPFEAAVVGLQPGQYTVRATVSGHNGRAEFSVSVLAQ